MNCLVSIIIPVFNGSDFLKESIDSALLQTYKNIEIIVVNDGSQDDNKTEKIALSYGEKIRYYYKENGGVSSALNFGIKKMNSEWFSWLSHDDIYDKNKITKQMQIVSNSKKKSEKLIIMSEDSHIDEHGDSIRKYGNNFKKTHYTNYQIFKFLFKGKSINGCTLLIPKEALMTAGFFDESLKYIQDRKMWTMLSLGDYLFVPVKENLVKMRIHKNQQTVKIKELRPAEMEQYVKELVVELSKNKNKYKKRIIDVIFWSIETGMSDITTICLDALKTSVNFQITDKIFIFLYYPVGKCKGLIEKNARIFLNYLRRI